MAVLLKGTESIWIMNVAQQIVLELGTFSNEFSGKAGTGQWLYGNRSSWNGWQLFVELLEQFLGLTEALTMSGVTYTTSSAYNERGELTSLTYPDSTVVDREYTDRGELYRLKHASTVIDTRGYDDGGRMTSSAYNNGVSESRSYGSDKTLSSISFTGSSIGNLSYAWDDNKNKTAETIAGTMSGYGFSVGSSGYDNEDRLVNFNRTDGNLDQSWSLSNVGDWNSVTTEGTAQSRTHGPTHELTAVAGSSVSADVNGNITLIPAAARPNAQSLLLNWDFDNRLSTADVGNNSSVDVTYKFDALGRRVYRQDSSSTTIYVQAGQQTIADYGSGTAASSPTYRYVYASYIDEPVFRYKPTGSESIYFHRNQQYSIIALTNGSGSIVERYAYSAYGVPTIADSSGSVLTSSAYSNRYTYTGREWDPVLLMYHYRARMYDANLGRFCSRDPIGYVDGYRLYHLDGLMDVDPSGNKTFRPTAIDVRTPFAKLTGNCRGNGVLPQPPGDSLVWAIFHFQLRARWPCRGLVGYFVQRVHGACLKDDCNGNTKFRSHFEYWEAWKVQAPADAKQRKRSKYWVIDTAAGSVEDNSRGARLQEGDIRFYCLAPQPDSQVEDGEISLAESDSERNTVLPSEETYNTSSLDLVGTLKRPDFWKRKPMAGESHRQFSYIWDCCTCPKQSNLVLGAASPRPEKFV